MRDINEGENARPLHPQDHEQAFFDGRVSQLSDVLSCLDGGCVSWTGRSRKIGEKRFKVEPQEHNVLTTE